MHEKTDEVVDRIYELYGSHTGHLFGLTPEHKGAVRGIVNVTIKIIEKKYEEEGRRRLIEIMDKLKKP